jgi:hypothetical protein
VAAGLLLTATCSRDSQPAGDRSPASVTAASEPRATRDEATQASTTPIEVQEIEARAAAIRSRSQSVRAVERDLSGFSAEGGTLNAFYDEGILTLVKATFYGETARSDQEFYYEDGRRPFLVVEYESQYEAPFGTVAGTREHRYYVREGRLIGAVADKRPVPADDAASAARATTLLKLSERLIEVAHGQKK